MSALTSSPRAYSVTGSTRSCHRVCFKFYIFTLIFGSPANYEARPLCVFRVCTESAVLRRHRHNVIPRRIGIINKNIVSPGSDFYILNINHVNTQRDLLFNSIQRSIITTYAPERFEFLACFLLVNFVSSSILKNPMLSYRTVSTRISDVQVRQDKYSSIIYIYVDIIFKCSLFATSYRPVSSSIPRRLWFLVENYCFLFPITI